MWFDGKPSFLSTTAHPPRNPPDAYPRAAPWPQPHVKPGRRSWFLGNRSQRGAPGDVPHRWQQTQRSKCGKVLPIPSKYDVSKRAERGRGSQVSVHAPRSLNTISRPSAICCLLSAGCWLLSVTLSNHRMQPHHSHPPSKRPSSFCW